MQILDWAIVLAFVVYATTVGLRARRRASRGLEEYFLAGRELRGWQAGLSMAATQSAADTPLLVTGLIATAGVFGLWRLWIYALAFLLMGFVLAGPWRRARVLTDAELAELRYGGRAATWLRGLKAIYLGTIFNCTVLAMVLWATKEVVEPFFLWEEWLPDWLFGSVQYLVEAVGVPFARSSADALDVWVRSTRNLISLAAIVGVTWLYSATGGLRSVVRTDVVQLAIMAIGTAGYAGVVLYEVGGMSALIESLHDVPGLDLSASQLLAFTPDLARDAGAMALAVLGLQWLVQMNADGTGYLAQRSMACRSDRDATQAALVFTGAQVVVRSLLWLPIALGLLVIFPIDLSQGGSLAAQREATFVRGMAELLPVGLRGLMLTAMLAALASTIDTHLNWGASYWTHDLYGSIWRDRVRGRPAGPATLVRVARISSLAILLLALAILTRLSSIQVAWHASLLLGAGMGVALVLRWLWWRINAWGELAAIGASLVLSPALLLGLPDQPEALRLLLMAAGGTGAAVLTSLATPPESRACLQRFYERVRPPGFWGPVSDQPGEDRARLWRGLAGVAAASVTTFGLLVGLGTLWLGSPAPLGLPHALWVAALLLAAAGATPVWWRLATGNHNQLAPAAES